MCPVLGLRQSFVLSNWGPTCIVHNSTVVEFNESTHWRPTGCLSKQARHRDGRMDSGTSYRYRYCTQTDKLLMSSTVLTIARITPLRQDGTDERVIIYKVE